MAPIAAHAEAFTFTSTTTMIDGVILPGMTPASRPLGAQVFSVVSKTTTADGKALTTQGKCATWFLPTGAQFGLSGACSFGDGTTQIYVVEYTCEMPAKDADGIDCWAKLIGTGGAYKGRSGTAVWLNRKDGTSQGTGQWD